MNAIPGKLHGHLASPFLLVHGVIHDERTGVPLFSLCYFHHEKDGDQRRSHNQAHTLDGIIIGCSPTLNALLVYNPCNKKYYKPDSYRIDSYWLPGSIYRNIKYDGGLLCNLIRDDTTPQWRKTTLLGLGLSALNPPLICCWRALSLISLSQMISHWILHLLILFSSTMVLQHLSLSQRWLTSFPSPRLILLLPILKTLFYRRSFA
jgi:hypothetical protein